MAEQTTTNFREQVIEPAKEAGFLSRKYGICPLAFHKCFATRDIEIFDSVCSKDNHKSCISFLKESPISKEVFDNQDYVVQFSENGTMLAISGDKK